jgi:hypothetical protein
LWSLFSKYYFKVKEKREKKDEELTRKRKVQQAKKEAQHRAKQMIMKVFKINILFTCTN